MRSDAITEKPEAADLPDGAGNREERAPDGDGWPLGRALERREDVPLLTGAGRYTDDVPLDDALHLSFLRSPFSCGRIAELDLEAAREMPGVIAVYSGADVTGLGSLRVNPLLDQVNAPPYPILAEGRVLAVGQPVAAIIAESLSIAQDAAELILLDVEEETPVVNIRQSASGAELFDGIPGNRALHQSWRTPGVDAAFESAELVVEARVQHPRLAPNPMEPRCAAATCDEESGDLTLWLSTQTPHRARRDIAAIARIDPERLRVISPDVGGAFGMKASVYPEEVFVAWASGRLKRSIRWTASRSEDLLSATHGRGALSEGSLALDREGRFLGIRAEIAVPLGHWLPHSAAVPAWNAARILPGPYGIEHLDITTSGYLTNTAPVGIYRGAGRPEAAALMERLVDEAARASGIDPIEIRLRNLLPATALPHKAPTGIELDSGDYRACLRRLSEIADYEALRRDVERRRRRGAVCGTGVAFYVEPCGQGWESARVALAPDGSISAATGTSSQGHGRETAFAQIVASVLRLDPSDIAIAHGDTGTAPRGIGALASRSTAIGGSALLRAAEELREKARGIAAEQLQAGNRELVLTDAGFTLTDTPERVIGWAEIAGGTGLSSEIVYETEGEAWGYGAYLATIGIDPETGVATVGHIFCVDDAGTLVNPTLVEGQILGGIAQGLGEATMEQVIYDDNGQLLTGSLTDYAIPRASDMAPVTLDKITTPSPFNALGAKGVGEAGTIGTPAAILNAAIDALTPFGVTQIDMPLTSEKIWRAMRPGQHGDR